MGVTACKVQGSALCCEGKLGQRDLATDYICRVLHCNNKRSPGTWHFVERQPYQALKHQAVSHGTNRCSIHHECMLQPFHQLRLQVSLSKAGGRQQASTYLFFAPTQNYTLQSSKQPIYSHRSPQGPLQQGCGKLQRLSPKATALQPPSPS